MLKTMVRAIAFKTGRMRNLYVKLCRPSGIEYADFLRVRGTFHSQGENCYIMTSTIFTDPKYVELGNNVQFATCTIFGHDGSIAMLNRAYGVVLDGVGPVRIKDNVFIGHNSIVMPGVTIGPNAIVAAGSVVNKNVPEGSIVSGIPARVVGSVEALVAWRQMKTEKLPWVGLLAARGQSGYDPTLEPSLVTQRIAYFFPEDAADSPRMEAKSPTAS
jgi:acetyltransferase-like isoleucine patch superfamily enzyme